MPTPRPTLIANAVVERLVPIGIGDPSVTILQPVASTKPSLLIKMAHALPADMMDAVLKVIRKAAGPGVQVEVAASDVSLSGIVAVKHAYRLALVPTPNSPRAELTTLAKALAVDKMRQHAHLASKIFKAGQPPSVQYHVLKYTATEPASQPQDSWERIVTGVILEPGVIDGTKTEESEGDIYSEDDVRKGMYYWMENNLGAFSYHHVEQGGSPLSTQDVALLENWQTRQPEQHGNQQIAKGAWMQTNRVRDTPAGNRLWKGILSGEINSWSIGAMAMGQLEEAPANL